MGSVRLVCILSATPSARVGSVHIAGDSVGARLVGTKAELLFTEGDD